MPFGQATSIPIKKISWTLLSRSITWWAPARVHIDMCAVYTQQHTDTRVCLDADFQAMYMAAMQSVYVHTHEYGKRK